MSDVEFDSIKVVVSTPEQSDRPMISDNINSKSDSDKPILTRKHSTKNSLSLLQKYLKRVASKADAHKNAEKWYSRANRMIGFPPVLLSTIVSVLGGIEYSNEDSSLALTVVSLSGVCAILTGSSSYLNFSKRASRHHDSSGNYADIKSDIEIFLASEFNRDELASFLNIQHEKMDIYETLEPNLSDKFYKKR